MCSDGILESNIEYENKEIWVKNLLEEIETDNVQKIAKENRVQGGLLKCHYR